MAKISCGVNISKIRRKFRAGAHDPNVVDCFAAVKDSFRDIALHFADPETAAVAAPHALQAMPPELDV